MHLDNRRNTKGTYNDNKIIHEKRYEKGTDTANTFK
jgi:hypothetical protein